MNHPAPPAQTRRVMRTLIRTHCMEVAQRAHPLRASAPLRAPCPRSCHWTQVAVAAREEAVKDALSICRRPALYSPTTPATRPAWWTSTSRERSTTAIRIRKVGTLDLIGPYPLLLPLMFAPMELPQFTCWSNEPHTSCTCPSCQFACCPRLLHQLRLRLRQRRPLADIVVLSLIISRGIRAELLKCRVQLQIKVRGGRKWSWLGGLILHDTQL